MVNVLQTGLGFGLCGEKDSFFANLRITRVNDSSATKLLCEKTYQQKKGVFHSEGDRQTCTKTSESYRAAYSVLYEVPFRRIAVFFYL